jgi:hypothetical protein
LDDPRFHPYLGSQRLRQLILETNQLLRLFRIRINVRRASFSISAPEQFSARADLL